MRIANVGTGSGQLSKQSSISSSASGADHASLRIERENSPISLTASGDVSWCLFFFSFQLHYTWSDSAGKLTNQKFAKMY